MWLLNTDTYTLEYFVESRIPKYAILSHTWSSDEVSFSDIKSPSCKGKSGYQKIEKTCQLASESGLKYAWVDTCCIDKSSSAELSEAINSMYRWYERSVMCIVYLVDLPSEAVLTVHLPLCRWFTRGWTLQELIAPKAICFYDQIWNLRGSKRDLIDALAEITMIDHDVLQKQRSLSSISVARKFSWAAHRQTTRIEDAAYCLIGLFDINMPLLYGEEQKAFRRLQIEIINTTPDLSIFAWKLSFPAEIRQQLTRRFYCGVLADTLAAFATSLYDTVRHSSPSWDFLCTNSGIKTRLQMVSVSLPESQGYRYILPLNCCSEDGERIGIRLRKCGPDQFVRDDPFSVFECDGFSYFNGPRERYLLTSLPSNLDHSAFTDRIDFASELSLAQSRSHALQIKLPESMDIYDSWSWGRFDDEDQIFFVGEDTMWDSAALRINGNFDLHQPGQGDINVRLDCMLFAIGWSDLRLDALQCSIMDYAAYAATLGEIRTRLMEWGPDRVPYLRTLEHHRIPRCSVAAIRIPDTDCSALVSLKPILVKDTTICASHFWRLELFCDVYRNGKLPKVSQELWSCDNST